MSAGGVRTTFNLFLRASFEYGLLDFFDNRTSFDLVALSEQIIDHGKLR